VRSGPALLSPGERAAYDIVAVRAPVRAGPHGYLMLRVFTDAPQTVSTAPIPADAVTVRTGS
jgi:hypothetical protein